MRASAPVTNQVAMPPRYRVQADQEATPVSPGAGRPGQGAGLCHLPAEAGAPLARWSYPELAREAVNQGVVEAISASTVTAHVLLRVPQRETSAAGYAAQRLRP